MNMPHMLHTAVISSSLQYITVQRFTTCKAH